VQPLRLFVGVWPGPPVIDALRAMRRPPGDGVRWLPEGQWHVTLDFLGNADPTVAAAGLARLVHPATVATLTADAHVLARSAVVFPVSGLEDLALAVRGALGTQGPARPEERRFFGHLTVGRLRRTTPARGLPLPEIAHAVSWPVNEVTLVRSELGEHGARYTVLQRVPLA